MLLIIGGFDPTAKAGILADAATAQKIGVPAHCSITTNTVQTETSFTRQSITEPNLFKAQLEALLETAPFSAVKLGFIADLQLAQIVYDLLRQYHLKNLVVDPVIVGKRANRVLVNNELLDFYIQKLLPLAELATPNWPEACVLTGDLVSTIPTPALVEEKAKRLSDLGRCNVLISGNNIEGRTLDYLKYYNTKDFSWLEDKSFSLKNPIIGLGCRLSTATATYLAQGLDLADAVKSAKSITAKYLESILPYPP